MPNHLSVAHRKRYISFKPHQARAIPMKATFCHGNRPCSVTFTVVTASVAPTKRGTKEMSLVLVVGGPGSSKNERHERNVPQHRYLSCGCKIDHPTASFTFRSIILLFRAPSSRMAPPPGRGASRTQLINKQKLLDASQCDARIDAGCGINSPDAIRARDGDVGGTEGEREGSARHRSKSAASSSGDPSLR